MPELRAKLQSLLGDAYRIERELTAGGMSRLFLATDTALDRSVVVKLLPPDLVSDQSLARFRREVDITAHLQHPHVLSVLGAGTREGCLYYIMPFVSGESLRARLDAHGALPMADALRLLREVADALAYAHSRHVIHRDIKPENILIEEGHAVLADFGIARAVFGTATEATRVTATGLSLGTLGYMAPEQLFGDPVDDRVDIYSLAVVAYEMLTGAPLFTAKTSQEVVAAHLMEVPKPLAEVLPGTPPEVSDAIAKALAKAPGDRLQTAAQLRDAFEAGLARLQTQSFIALAPALRARSPRARAAIWGGALVAAVTIAAAGTLAVRARAGARLDRDLVAVVPFDVAGTDVALWREGMVDLLARKLDGAGPLHTIAPATVVRRWGSGGDAAAATALARELSAGIAVLGSLVRKADSVTLHARAIDAANGRVLADVEVRGSMGNMGGLSDSLTIRLLGGLARTRAISATPRPGLTASSLEALRAFLEGEQFYRRLAWDSARVAYERAIYLDPSFALALRRAGLTVSWQTDVQDSVVRTYLLRAGARNRHLGQRDSLLISADSLRASLDLFDADSTWLPRARRLFTTLEQATRRYPSDPEVWYALGDAQTHYAFGTQLGVVDREILANLDRSITLDSAFAPAYIHAIELALSLDDSRAALDYARFYLALAPGAEDEHGIRLVAPIIDYAEARSPRLGTLLDTASTRSLSNAWIMLRRWPDDDETAVRVVRALYDRRLRDVAFADTALARTYLSLQLAYRGHMREAASFDDGASTPFEVELALLGGIPADSADAMLARWPPGLGPATTATPWWGARRDTAMLARELRRADSIIARSSNPIVRRGARYSAAQARAYEALARGDSATALARFRSLPDSVCMGCALDRLEKARLLLASGDPASAARFVDERIFSLLSPAEVLEALERGRVAERMGERGKAIDAFSLVSRTWANADSTLRPIVAEANAALSRLGAVASRGGAAAGGRRPSQ